MECCLPYYDHVPNLSRDQEFLVFEILVFITNWYGFDCGAGGG